MASRAGIIVTGTEVLTGRVTDRNGPWLAERLRELGVDVAHIAVVGDRTEDIAGALRFFRDEGLDLVVTSGGLGPTADDLTADVVGHFQERPLVFDEALCRRITAIVAPLLARWPNVDPQAMASATRKQAMVPDGAIVLEPVGTAPGLVVPPPTGTAPTVVVLPGPPRELQPMWEVATGTQAFRAALGATVEYRQTMLRLFGIPESEIAETLRVAEGGSGALEGLEITTCLRRGEVEVVTRYQPAYQAAYERFEATVRERHADTLFSDDGRSVDEQVADALLAAGQTIATAESCTGGLLSGRLTERAGSSAYALGGLVVYSDAAKVSLAGVDPALIARVGAVSPEVADALADGAREALDADVGVGITGIAGPGGGTQVKPVGTVCFSVSTRERVRVTRTMLLPGSRFDVRDRSTTVALHMVRRVLLGGGHPEGL
ncbi:MAG: ADP-ribose pyrophosphatase of COG1058 family / Nicotinamide-nucleotide amidase [uncultured Solirubrobacteraceae bacterium]|uniref:CinA-like protein n=1 Tax=uncultured Solirubrobacteraceae bacterium TaxID=1162706 RepID=A0A6J4SDM5_9ACTN|nr:MAG: ADP-ribose pyrophosphatase of COG1058 family / Nicotinamide-nucleotide amidase [uncultured Solirubrobacteraceae bacterium]